LHCVAAITETPQQRHSLDGGTMGYQLAPLSSPDVADRENNDLCQIYARHFTTVRADTDPLKAQFYRLRYQVYCVENAFEDPSALAGEMERDSFDDHSVSSLLIHRQTGVIAGGIRLILPAEGGTAREFPLWSVCDRHALEFHSRELPRERTAEVSRNAISKQARKLMASLSGSGVDTLHQMMRHLSLGLLAAVIRMSAEHGITHICATMDAPTIRMFARLGLHFQKLGPMVEFHGLRQPIFTELDSMLARTWIERPEVWALMTRNGVDWPLNQRLAVSTAWPARRETAH
jgi:N-acyl amino acid synthase of PEP-CTERM/exosortase system